MEALTKLENIILGWFKNVPHLPESVRSWLGTNVWWIVLVGAILSAVSALFALTGVMAIVSLLGTVGASYYAASAVSTWPIVTGLVSIAFSVLNIILLAMAIKPLQLKQKKGWVLLFAAWLLSAVSVVISSLITFNVLTVIPSLLFGAIGLAISGYFLFEIHGQFAHVQKSRGVKEATTK